MNLKELNQAENKLVVGGIKVLGSMEGPGVVSIKQNIDSLQNAVQTVTQKTEDYWSDIANDNIITPSEKKVLKKEWNTIQTTYSAILDLAREKGIDQTEDFINYANYYQALYNYLFQKIKVFDNMAENTPIPNITTYQTHFNNYYDQEIICQSVLNATSSTFTVRNLNSLDETGTANEIAMYNGQFYRYNIGTHEWEYVSAGKYMGIMNSLPDPVIDSYFLAGVDFAVTLGLLTNKGILKLHNGNVLGVKKQFKKGELYVYTPNGWQRIVNHNDYRYLIATNDLVSIGAAISPNLEDTLKPPHYRSTSIDIPETYRNGDWFLYTGVERDIQYGEYSTHFEYGKLYKFNKPVWAELDPNDSNNSREFMEALNDILKVHTANDGYFNTIFAQSLFANQATLNALSVETLTLREGSENKKGAIQSDNWEQGQTGFKLNHDGSAEFNGETSIGGNTTIKGDTTITGNCSIGENAIFFGTLQTSGFTVVPLQTEITFPQILKYDEWNFLRSITVIDPDSTYGTEIVIGIDVQIEEYVYRAVGGRYWAYYKVYLTIETANNKYEFYQDTSDYRVQGYPDTYPDAKELTLKELRATGHLQKYINFNIGKTLYYKGTYNSLKIGDLPHYDPHVKGSLFITNDEEDTVLHISRG